MIPVVDRGTHQLDGPVQSRSANASLSRPVPTPRPLPPDRSLSIAHAFPRPSVPPSQPPPQLQNKTRILDLRARNELFQKAISHLDNAIIHLLAARCGIPNGKLEKVLGRAKTKAERLKRVDRAIEMAKEGGWVEDECFDGLEDVKCEGNIGAGKQSSSGSSTVSVPGTSDISQAIGILPYHPPSNVAQAQSLPSDAHHLRRFSQLQIAQQVPQKMCTLAELVRRRKALHESLVSLHHAAGQVRPTAEPSLSVKYQQIQLEIKRREEYMAHLN
ncbi:hypothetical protein F5I97DRAFT_1475873 [Phlebopus sp. FC_14]|nr:hypothetical protein F5I97DRAFT_1475873 [Phlebopus sp. FC_14]